MLGILVMFTLLVILAGCLPNRWHVHRWGYLPSAAAGVLLIVAVTLVFADKL